MESVKHVYRAPVGVYIALEAQFVTEQFRHVIRRSGNGDAVIGAVAVHYGQRLLIFYDTLKRNEIQVTEFMFASLDGCQVQAAGRVAVCKEVLRRGDFSFCVHRRHIGIAHT